jgi:hypothetical protein
MVRVLATAWLIGLAVTACSAPPAAGTSHVWVGGDATSAVMVQLTRQDNSLTGTFDEAGLDGVESARVKPVHVAFTGTVDGTALTLTLSGGLGFATTVSGSLSGDEMILQAPQGDGSIAAVTLRPSSVDAYNRQVAGVQATAQANADASVAAADAAASAAAVRTARARIDSAAHALSEEVAALRTAGDGSPSFEGFKADLVDARDHLAQAKSHAAAAAAESDPTAACDDATAATDDATAVHDAATGVGDETTAVGDTVTAVTEAADRLDQALTAYRQALATMPEYAAADAPDTEAIQAVRKHAVERTGAWQAAAAGYQRQVAQLVTAADAVAAKADKRFC